MSFIGWLQTLAMIYFAALTLKPDSFWGYRFADALGLAAFGIRAVYFWLMVCDEKADTLLNYYKAMKWTGYIVVGASVISMTLYALEWYVMPWWELFFWLVVFGANYLHAEAIKDYGNIKDDNNIFVPTVSASFRTSKKVQ